MDQGRRYRANEIYVKDWETFKSVWKDNSFIKELANKSADQTKQICRKKFIELVEDQSRQCYIFPDSLKPQYVDLMIKLVQQNEFKYSLDYEHEGLYLDKPKQLIIFRKRSSVSIYLSKYRHPSEYKKVFADALDVLRKLQELIIQRNIKISQQLPKQQYAGISNKIQQFKVKNLEPKLKAWRNLVIRMIVDFKKQNKKLEMLFLGVNSILYEELKVLCSNHQIYINNRFQNISKYDDFRDVVINKIDRNQSSQSFDDNSLSSQEDQEPKQQTQAVEVEKQIIVKAPKDIATVTFKQYVKNGVSCTINLYSYGKANPIDYIRIRLLSPNQTQQQRSYQQKIDVIEGQYEYNIILPCFKSGCSAFQIVAVNSVGMNKNPYIYKIFMQAINDSADSQGIMRLQLQNYSLYVLGKNQDGLIPNWNTQNKNIITTTQEAWQMSKFPCAEFSASSHSIICNRNGCVAGWGKMYFFDEETLSQNINDQEQEDDDLGLIKMNSLFYRTEPPSLISQSSKIVKVSCGDGYCLMIDYLGKVWSFGINNFGQLGLEHTDQSSDTSDPAIIRYFQHEKIFVKDVIASCFGASFAIDDKGQGYRWGTNQLQQSDRPVKDTYGNVINFQYPEIIAAQSTPTPISKKALSQKIKSIHPGQHFVLALTQSQKLYGWGRTKYLGKGKMQDAHFNNIDNICNPIHIEDEVKQISVGLRHCLMLKKDNTLFAWGESKAFRRAQQNRQFIQKPQKLISNYEGQFVCGPDFTVFHDEPGTITVNGKPQIFTQGKYKLPTKLVKLQAGQGVIMMTGISQKVQVVQQPIKQNMDNQPAEWNSE